MKKVLFVLIVLSYMFMLGNLVHAQTVQSHEYTVTRAAMLTVVTIDVNGSPRNFVVDTGAQITLVTPSVLGKPLAAYRAASNGTSTGSGIGGSAAVIYGKADIAFGGLDLKNFDVVVIPGSMDKLSKATGIRIDGLLAQDILARFGRVIFDYKAGKMIVESK